VNAQADVAEGADGEENAAVGLHEILEELIVVGGMNGVVDSVDAKVKDGRADPVRRSLLSGVHGQMRKTDLAGELVNRSELGGRVVLFSRVGTETDDVSRSDVGLETLDSFAGGVDGKVLDEASDQRGGDAKFSLALLEKKRVLADRRGREQGRRWRDNRSRWFGWETGEDGRKEEKVKTHLCKSFLQPLDDHVQLDPPPSVSLRVEERLAVLESVRRSSLHVSVGQRLEVLLKEQDVHSSVEVAEEVIKVAEVPVAVSRESEQDDLEIEGGGRTAPRGLRWSSKVQEREEYHFSSKGQRAAPGRGNPRCGCGVRTVEIRRISKALKRERGEKRTLGRARRNSTAVMRQRLERCTKEYWKGERTVRGAHCEEERVSAGERSEERGGNALFTGR
jgi:hypothetical protein